MTMEELLRETAERMNNGRKQYSNAETRRIVECFFEVVEEHLRYGVEARVTGFGKFKIGFRPERKFRSEFTGNMEVVPERPHIAFKPSKRLLEKMPQRLKDVAFSLPRKE